MKSRPNERANDDDDDDDSEPGSDDEEGDTQELASPEAVSLSAKSPAYSEFLQFLQLGCYGSPVQGYQCIVVILSTIPNTVRLHFHTSFHYLSTYSIQILGHDVDSWNELLTSFWAALDGKALSSLDRVQSSAAFLSSLMESLVYLIRRAKAAKGLQQRDVERIVVLNEEELRGIVSEQICRVWSEIVSKRLRVDDAEGGKILARTFASLNGVDESEYLTRIYSVNTHAIRVFQAYHYLRGSS